MRKNTSICDDRPDATGRYVRAALPRQALAHPVGKVCAHCNLNYDLLGLVIEAAITREVSMASSPAAAHPKPVS